MTSADLNATAERHQSLWLLTAGPGIWTAHFLLSYLTAAIYCAKAAGPEESLLPVRLLIGGYTVAAMVGIGFSARMGYRRHGYGSAATPHDYDSPEDRHRFLGLAMLLLCGLSFVGVVFVGMAACFVEDCR